MKFLEAHVRKVAAKHVDAVIEDLKPFPSLVGVAFGGAIVGLGIVTVVYWVIGSPPFQFNIASTCLVAVGAVLGAVGGRLWTAKRKRSRSSSD